MGRVVDRGSYASGTDFVEKTGLAKLHRGEAVIPAKRNKKRNKKGKKGAIAGMLSGRFTKKA